VFANAAKLSGIAQSEFDTIIKNKGKDILPNEAGGSFEGWLEPGTYNVKSMKSASEILKAMVDADIAADRASYSSVAAKPDPNIDFRRTGVLDVFFGKYGITLTNDVNDHAQWQQGDIVVFDRVKHIGVISDKRDADGFSYVLHNMNQQRRENDYLAFSRRMGVTGHYRWDASRVPKSVLRAWKG
jgi:hypothetical protein